MSERLAQETWDPAATAVPLRKSLAALTDLWHGTRTPITVDNLHFYFYCDLWCFASLVFVKNAPAACCKSAQHSKVKLSGSCFMGISEFILHFNVTKHLVSPYPENLNIFKRYFVRPQH